MQKPVKKRLRASFQGALGKINLLSAGIAFVFLVKFVGKNFLGLAALRAFA
jgi:hypothetical protein